MANDKDFILKNAIEVGGSTKVTVGDAAAAGSYNIAYNLSVASYDSKSLLVSTQDSNERSFALSSDGTKLYMVGSTNNAVYEYSLSTAWDLSTASYNSVSFSLSSQTTDWTDIRFKPDGTKMYLLTAVTDIVYQYSLSTAWDLSTASYDSVSFSVSTQSAAPYGLFFKPDGTKMYVYDVSSTRIYSYSLSTVWNVSTASYDSISYFVPTAYSTTNTIEFKPDGTKLYLFEYNTDSIHQFSLSPAWDISTISYDNVSYSGTSQDGTITKGTFSSNGETLYLLGFSTSTIYQYSTYSTVTTGNFDLSTGNYFTDTPSADAEYGFSNAGDVQTFQLEVTGGLKGYELSGAAYDSVSFSVAGQSSLPVAGRLGASGTKMFICNYYGNILQYTLSTAYDVSSASYDSVAYNPSEAANLQGLEFKADGTKMYVMDYGGTDSVFQYSLGTAWDISTASYDSKSFSLSSQDTSNQGIFMRQDDGLKLYLMAADDKVYQYTLSTAWDISTASYDSKSYSVNSEETTPTEVFFSSDGLKFFISGLSGDDVTEYSMTTAWDVSTASPTGNTVSSQATQPYGLFFKPDGTKMYIVTDTNDTIYQYSTGSAYTITWDADIEWGGGTAPSSPAANQKDLYTITTDDGGTTYFGVPSGVAFS